MFYDAHVHTTFSPDGKSPMSEYMTLIDEGKLKGIGFAEHLDFLPECGAYQFLDYKAYRKSVDDFRTKGYEVYAGAEIDYSHKVEQDILTRIREEHYDFTLCSIHMVHGLAVSDRNIDYFFDKHAFYKMVEGYYGEINCSIKVKEFDAIGHVGVFRRYLEDSFYNEGNLRQWLDQLDFEVARVCAQSDKIIEVNSSGLYALCASTVPRKAFLKWYYDFGGRRVCLSSDAHNAAHAGRGFENVKELLSSIGFKYLFLPWDKENPISMK